MELADLWVPLKRKLALSFQSKLHLRIFLDNTKGVHNVKEYLKKIEKEVGKKVRTNLTTFSYFGSKKESSFLVFLLLVCS